MSSNKCEPFRINQLADLASGCDKCTICLHFKPVGKRFGSQIPVCHPCSQFFMRTVKKGSTPMKAEVCQGNCPFQYYSRTSCDHCRFQKCLQLGMQRAPTDAPLLAQKWNTQQQPECSTALESDIELPPTVVQLNPASLFNFKLIVSEPYPWEFNELLQEASGRTFVLIVNWVKNQPFFNYLPFDAQVLALQSNWIGLFFWGLLELSNQNSEEKILDEMDKIFQDVLMDIYGLRLDEYELEALKGTLLFCPAVYPDSVPNMVFAMKSIHTKIVDEWKYYRVNLKRNKCGEKRVNSALVLRDNIIKATKQVEFKRFYENHLATNDQVLEIIFLMIENKQNIFEGLLKHINGPTFWANNSLAKILFFLKT